MAQVKILNCIGLMYSGDMPSAAKYWQADLRDFYENHWTNLLAEVDQEVVDCSATTEKRWKVWYGAEGLRRTGYCIWVGGFQVLVHVHPLIIRLGPGLHVGVPFLITASAVHR